MTETLNPLVLSLFCPNTSEPEQAEPSDSGRTNKIGPSVIQDLCTNPNNFDSDGKVRLNNLQNIVKQWT